MLWLPNIDIYRGFIEKFRLFWDRREALGVTYLNGAARVVISFNT